MRVLATVAVGVLVVVAPACGSAVGAGSAGSPSDPVVSTPADSNPDTYGPPPPDFGAPPPGFEPTTAGDVNKGLPYTLVYPDGLGTPKLYSNPGVDMVALVYDSPVYGPVWLKEWPTQSDATSLKAWADRCAPGNGCQGDWSEVTLADGTPALLITDGADTSLTWFDGSVRFDLQAPVTMAGKDATAIGDAVQQAMATKTQTQTTAP